MVVKIQLLIEKRRKSIKLLVMITADKLQRYSFFGGLTSEQIDKYIIPLLVYKDFKFDEMIIREGETNDSIYFLLEGSVDILKNNKVIAVLGEGQTVGEMELLDIMPAAATVRARQPIKTAVISNKAIYQIYCDSCIVFAMLVMNLARDLSRRLRQMDEAYTALEYACFNR